MTNTFEKISNHFQNLSWVIRALCTQTESSSCDYSSTAKPTATPRAWEDWRATKPRSCSLSFSPQSYIYNQSSVLESAKHWTYLTSFKSIFFQLSISQLSKQFNDSHLFALLYFKDLQYMLLCLSHSGYHYIRVWHDSRSLCTLN